MLQHLKNQANVTRTENGAVAFKSTKSALLDYFAMAGAVDGASDEQRLINMFTGALGEDRLRAMKALFRIRDVRGGQGKRNNFRIVTRYLGNQHPDLIGKNVHLFGEFGRFDDLYVLVGTSAERYVADFIKAQFKADMASKTPSLLGKWLKSENASSEETRKFARWTMKVVGLTPRKYRQALTHLRAKIGTIVEVPMSKREFGRIEYDAISSKAGMKYKKAFLKRDESRYTEFLNGLKNGTKKVNSGTLYPHEIMSKVWSRYGRSYTGHDAALYNGMWANLPDYYEGAEHVADMWMPDVSGSMDSIVMKGSSVKAVDVSMALAVYGAQRNKGKFHNHFISFTSQPQLIELRGSTLTEVCDNLPEIVGYDTNVEAAMLLILNTAIKHKLPQSELPARLFLVSDMEFNGSEFQSCQRMTDSLFRSIKARFEAAGYKMPLIVFWNVNARNTQTPMTMDDRGIMFVSGFSPSILKNLLAGKFMEKPEEVNPYDVMIEVLDSERYGAITV